MPVHAHYNIDNNYRIDVHSHPVPDLWRNALIEAGNPVMNGALWNEGFPVPEWSLDAHIANMNDYGLNYSTLSITAPGVSFLSSKPKTMKSLARALIDQLYKYTQAYPDRLE
ncbi:hypothetical protein N8T08_003776 [Aspergillus melleus]|uniref:Uncharacterized protein n=1 Tax=Aspergillus melleus TaxID=138277 RepID=A0ACC3B729_9EURO|nr:hypothetical protein N8T08_003776 [Aspergillus melleus]